ncbi:MAG: Re/Si-specific NAD(P)(+) transhydrogenase subunit alpha [Planctomycetota bacterium]
MIIGTLKESKPGERRVAITPASATKLSKLGYEVLVESGCGSLASFPDGHYDSAGATVERSREKIIQQSDILIQVEALTGEEAKIVKPGTALISFLWPAQNPDLVELLRESSITSFAMDCVPRISRAQKMDALSSMANIAGYRAVVEAANEFGSFFTGQITAAGKVPPAKVLVIGAGVAGLAAIGTAKSLGAIVRAFDTRLAVKEQVKSMGAEFLELEFEESGEGEGGYAKVMSDEFIAAEMDLFAQQAKEVDIIVTTALIPGKPAPVLITRDMVKSMKPGSVIVDLAAQNGGNCEMTQPGQKIVTHDITIIGYEDLPSRLPTQSSQLYATNLVNLITDMTPGKDGQFVIDLDDQIVRGSVVTMDQQTMWPPPKIVDPSPPVPEPATEKKGLLVESESESDRVGFAAIFQVVGQAALAAFALGLLYLIGAYAPPSFVQHFTVFVLACFVGYQLVWNVTPALHTPLMSVTNAISGIILIGGMLQMGKGLDGAWMPTILAGLAVLIATINIAGGFLVTQRMLSMFRKQG